MPFSQSSQFLSRFVRSVRLAGCDLFKGAVDLLIERLALFLGPGFLGIQNFQDATNDFWIPASRSGS